MHPAVEELGTEGDFCIRASGYYLSEQGEQDTYLLNVKCQTVVFSHEQ